MTCFDATRDVKREAVGRREKIQKCINEACSRALLSHSGKLLGPTMLSNSRSLCAWCVQALRSDAAAVIAISQRSFSTSCMAQKLNPSAPRMSTPIDRTNDKIGALTQVHTGVPLEQPQPRTPTPSASSTSKHKGERRLVVPLGQLQEQLGAEAQAQARKLQLLY